MKKTDWKYLVDVFMFLTMFGIFAVGLLMAFFLKEGPAVKESDKFFLGLHRHQWGDIHLYLSLAFTAALIAHLVLEWSWIKGKSQRIFKRSWRPALGIIGMAAISVPLVFWIFMTKNDPQYAMIGFGQGQARVMNQPSYRDRSLPPSESVKKEPAARRQEIPAAQRPAEKREPVDQEIRHDSSDKQTRLVSGREEGSLSGFVVTGRMTLLQVEKETGIAAGRILEKMGLPSHVSRNETLGRLRRLYGFNMTDFRAAIEELIDKR